MTGTRTLTDLVPGGGTVSLTVTARTSNLDIESTILAAQRKQATVVHKRLAEQVASWRRERYTMRADLGGEPAPESHTSTLPPVPMPGGRMRTWETADAVWLQWIPVGEPLDLDHAVAQRVPVSANDTAEQLVAAAERWLTGYGCPPAGTAEWVIPQLRRHRDRLADAQR
ncbi:hypothetical protein [Tsukamurella paurometabola]|uniref:Uncharacterized protein n=1 Tax=Tsukamurella paurometabola TaxID=2061 RepID=A0A3P8MAV8_TSUPA|nr:hypothetical protein [Tsukamurella paurometabola]UEA81644.1 hypothetical protein LK411_14705 [Tsukamurella paurometabola]VDR38650.1 Uncharacterised protein [Tsukamurella paurometabola]